MNQSSKTIFKNAGYLMTSQLITWGLALVLTVILPRYLGPTATGQFHLAYSIWAIVGIFISFGMDTYMVKEIARNPEQVSRMVGSSLVIRTLLYFIGFGLVAIYIYLVSYSTQAVSVIIIIGISILFQQYSSVYFSILTGFERMQYLALVEVVVKLFSTIASIVLVVAGSGVLSIAAVSIGTSIISLILSVYFANQVQKIRLHFQPHYVIKMLRESVVYLSVAVFRTLYIQVDIIIISFLVSETMVGWYGAADRLFGTLLFVPTVFITAAFPALSRMYSEASEELPQLMQKSFTMLLMISIPIGLGTFLVADNLVLLLFGPEFAASGPVLAIMGIVLIFTYMNMLMGRFLIATNRQHIWSIVIAIATVATIPLDLILVPWCQQTFGNGAMGGALAFVITEFGMLMVGLRFLPKGYLSRSHVLWMATRMSIAGAVMVLVVWQIRDFFIAIPVIVGALIYVGLILLMGVVSKDDRQIFQAMVKSVLLKFRRFQTRPANL